jgi:predicted N-acetyltransferase YhbS
MKQIMRSVEIKEAATDVGHQIEAQLLASIRSTLPQSINTHFVLAARDGQGSLVGGLVGGTSYGWLLTKCLWVADDHRKLGLGRALMYRAEQKARESGCHGAWLDTSSPDAMNFYSKLGYTSFGQLANHHGQHPESHRRWFMSKPL